MDTYRINAVLLPELWISVKKGCVTQLVSTENLVFILPYESYWTDYDI